jgi:hypothetical protein
MQLEGLGEFKKNKVLFGNRTRDLPACNIVPQPTTLPHAPYSDTYTGSAKYDAVLALKLMNFVLWNT